MPISPWIQWIQELYPETFASICAQLKKQVFETKDLRLRDSTVVVVCGQMNDVVS